MATRHYQPAMHDLELGSVEKLNLGEFADRQLRNGFLRKVFGLLAVQLAITTALGAACVFSEGVKGFLFSHPVIPTVACVGSLLILLTLSVSETARSSHPTNLVLLFTFTLFESVLVGLASSRYSPELVFSAFAMTAAVSTGLCIYAMRTKTDFTMMGGFLHSMLMCFLLTIVIACFFNVPIMGLGISLAGACLFSAYLVYDVQLIMGGHHQHKISPDEYVLATISIYLDIINLFLYILRMLSEGRRD